MITVSQLQLSIDERIFSERDRVILKRRYIDGLTYKEIADENFMSEKQIRRICKNNENTIYKGLK